MTLLEWTVQITNTILSWPVAVFSVVLLMRKNIRELINSVSKKICELANLQNNWATLNFARQQSKDDDLDKLTIPEISTDKNKITSSESVQYKTIEYMEIPDILNAQSVVNLRKDFIKIINESKNTSIEYNINILIANLAISRLESHFAHTYILIYGSQLNLLRHLFENGPTKITDAKEFYFNAKEIYKDVYNNYEYLSWLNFIKDRKLIEIHNAQISLTVEGSDFISVWMERVPYSKDKPY